ncbi:MAG: MoxR family ATPase [Palaeococcus sp.]|uniref:AAA family ATPase n=1 Tax=Palaeococcus sp. (in: euryarchaeotes) TaxID=2820298 RepID=UPI0025D598C4|nr:MoxR family ATPase [Palaeococcus sp. (in: euryarchaeotes)]MCD6558637.1 MoxR family ATPase [Palaeococcus sp. (in: euryarchaeotes)]
MDGREFLKMLEREMDKAVVGKRRVIELLSVALLSRGHVLLEGVPGVAKTTIAKNFANTLGLKFSRIQLTPDLMPADIIGGLFFDQKSGEFKIRKGPIFANVVLADEINRAQPKTQSALLEAMQEDQVTIEGISFKLPQPFLVIATKNPLEHEGVYELPEAQLDRFVLKIDVGYPSKEEEIHMLKRKHLGEFAETRTVFNLQTLLSVMEEVKKVYVSDEVLHYIYEIIAKTRVNEKLVYGASPRGAEHLLYTSKAIAFLRGRNYVIPDDVKDMAIPTLIHRVAVKAEYEIDGVREKDVIEEILEEVEIPKG